MLLPAVAAYFILPATLRCLLLLPLLIYATAAIDIDAATPYATLIWRYDTLPPLPPHCYAPILTLLR